MKTLNLGILAHVDAGKTTLTERLLFAGGVIDAVGRVDDGTTQTDTMALERRRGITIRAAVVAFTVDDLTVNLIDTPGHPDFIAEVDRSLQVLDGAVLVLSAVEGVQAQTVVLHRALARLGVPTLLFVNKIDRLGADPERVIEAIRSRLTDGAVPLGTVERAGAPDARFVPDEYDDELLDDLAVRTAAGELQPVVCGSAATGAGIDALRAALTRLLPTAGGDPSAPASGAVFKVERGGSGERLAYVRMYAGTVRVREKVTFGRDDEATVTAVRVFEHGRAVDRPEARAGQIATLTGLKAVRVGDVVGAAPPRPTSRQFALPTLETAVVPRVPAQKAALHRALTELAEQDPLIDLRQDDVRQELFVSLYGEVQQEVLEETLRADHGIEIEFRDTTTICIERPTGTGQAVEHLGRGNPFLATVGYRIEPAPVGSGIAVRFALDVATVPRYVYKTVDAFEAVIAQHVRTTLRQGLFGWEVADCVVTMTDSDYTSPSTSAADFRKLTPLVLMAALRDAGTVVCEPIQRIHVDAPADRLSAVLGLLAQLRVVPDAPAVDGEWCRIDGEVRSADISRFRRQLHGLTRGEGVAEVGEARYAPVTGPPPVRPRTDANPLDRKEYLRHVLGRQ